MIAPTSTAGIAAPAHAAVATRGFQALGSLRRLADAHLPADLQRVVAGFAKALGAHRYAFVITDRHGTKGWSWSCDDASQWWRQLEPEMHALLHDARHDCLWFGAEPVAGEPAGRDAWLRDAGIRSGLAVAVEALHPGSVAACLVLGFRDEGIGSPRDRDALQWLARHGASLVFDSYMRLPPGPAQGAPRLSARERECLQWAAVGKTSWETGCILEVGERTVNFHLRNAFGKLNVNNKLAAVAQAILQGLI